MSAISLIGTAGNDSGRRILLIYYGDMCMSGVVSRFTRMLYVIIATRVVIKFSLCEALHLTLYLIINYCIIFYYD